MRHFRSASGPLSFTKHFGLLTELGEIAEHQKVIEILNGTLARRDKNAPKIAAAKARRAARK